MKPREAGLVAIFKRLAGLFLAQLALLPLSASAAIDSAYSHFLTGKGACSSTDECVPSAISRIDVDIDGDGLQDLFLANGDTTDKRGPIWSVYLRRAVGFEFLGTTVFNENWFYIDLEARKAISMSPAGLDKFYLVEWTITENSWSETSRKYYNLDDGQPATQQLEDEFVVRAAQFRRESGAIFSVAQAIDAPEDLYVLGEWRDLFTGLPLPNLPPIDGEPIQRKAETICDPAPKSDLDLPLDESSSGGGSP